MPEPEVVAVEAGLTKIKGHDQLVLAQQTGGSGHSLSYWLAWYVAAA